MLRPVSCLSVGNMMLFDAEGKIRRYETPEQIVQEFFDLRLSFYAKRKAALLKVYAPAPERARLHAIELADHASCVCRAPVQQAVLNGTPV